MAVDTQAFRLLLAARTANADFSRTITFGRQNFFPKARHASRALAASGLGLTLPQVGALRHAYAEKFFTALGAKTVEAIDASDYEQAAVVHDLNQPVPSEMHEKYSLVFDGGTSEHVYHYPQVLANAMKLLAVGGHFVSITSGNNQSGHGFYQFSPELFYRVFSAENGFETRAVFLIESQPGGRFYRVADPAVVGHRIEFTNTKPMYVALITRKIRTIDVLKVMPQQSDYSTRWQDPTSSGSQPPGRIQRELWRMGHSIRNFTGRHFYLPWQNPGISALSDTELYSL